jgi:hypothetical protein
MDPAKLRSTGISHRPGLRESGFSPCDLVGFDSACSDVLVHSGSQSGAHDDCGRSEARVKEKQ